MGCCGSYSVQNLPSRSTLTDILTNKTERLKIDSSFDDSSCLSISQIPFLSNSVNNIPDTNFSNTFELLGKNTPFETQIPPKTLYCNNNHILTWDTQVVFRSFQSTSSWTLICESCSSNFSSACWHCKACTYSICEICGNLNGNKPPHLKCRKNHILLWSPETIWDYRKDSTSEIFACDLCKEIKHEPSWNCDKCGYDICIPCGEKQKIEPCQNYLECFFNHKLSYVTLLLDESQYETYGIQCKTCQNWVDPDSPFCQCEVHDVDVCLKCVDDELKSLVPHPGFRCKDGKVMKIVAKEWVLQEIGDSVACDICKTEYFEYAFMCTDCFLCYCFSCGKDLHVKILNSYKETCKIGHQLVYKSPEEGDFVCVICREYFNTGFFTCESCNYKICVKDLELS